jgi:hypothetical protein
VASGSPRWQPSSPRPTPTPSRALTSPPHRLLAREGASKGARSGNPQIRALQAENQALRAGHRELLARNQQADDRLSELRRQHDRLIARHEETYAQLAGLRDERWDQSFARLLAAASSLVAARDAAELERAGTSWNELEQATAELLADQLLELHDRYDEAVDPSRWLESVIGNLADDDTDVAWYLLHGIAAICPPEQAPQVRAPIEERSPTAPPSPSWSRSHGPASRPGRTCWTSTSARDTRRSWRPVGTPRPRPR